VSLERKNLLGETSVGETWVTGTETKLTFSTIKLVIRVLSRVLTGELPKNVAIGVTAENKIKSGLRRVFATFIRINVSELKT
jgi:hypothetical protein